VVDRETNLGTIVRICREERSSIWEGFFEEFINDERFVDGTPFKCESRDKTLGRNLEEFLVLAVRILLLILIWNTLFLKCDPCALYKGTKPAY